MYKFTRYNVVKVFFVIAVVLINKLAIADDVCNTLIQKSQTSPKRTVYLSDGNAWDLLQKYLQDAEKNSQKIDIKQLKVVYVTNKTKKEHTQNWATSITGQGPKEAWSNMLKKVKADVDETAFKDAIRQQWDIVCYAGSDGQAKPKTDNATKVPSSTSDKVPLEAKQHFQQGMQYAARKDFQNAVGEFANAIKLYPAYAAAYSNRGVAYMQQKKMDLAEDDLKKAVELAPKDANNHYNLACWYSISKQAGKGLVALEAAFDNGFNDYGSLRKDPDLANLRKSADWQSTLEKHKIFLTK